MPTVGFAKVGLTNLFAVMQEPAQAFLREKIAQNEGIKANEIKIADAKVDDNSFAATLCVPGGGFHIRSRAFRHDPCTPDGRPRER